MPLKVTDKDAWFDDLDKLVEDLKGLVKLSLFVEYVANVIHGRNVAGPPPRPLSFYQTNIADGKIFVKL